MKIKSLLTIALTSLLFFSCEDSAQKVINVNDAVITAYNNVYYDSKVLEDKLSEVIEAETMKEADFKGLTEVRLKFKTTVDENLKKAEEIENYGGSEEFKTAVIDYLKHMQSLNDFVIKFEAFTEETTGEELLTWVNELDKKANLETSLINKVQNAQTNFAKKNNLELIEQK
jgi:hypothetical protein